MDIPFAAGRAVAQGVPDGEQELVVQAPGYRPVTSRVVVKNGRGSAAVRLTALTGTLEVTARPGTSVIAVDARGKETRIGTIPAGGLLAVPDGLPVSRYTIRLDHADCAPVEVKDVGLMVGRTATIAPAQTPLPGELRVFSVPTGAEVRVNGQVVGQSPATLREQPSEQPLLIEVFLSGYQRVEQRVILKPRESRTVDVGTLLAEVSAVDFDISPADVRLDQAKMSVDGKAVTPLRIGGGWRAGVDPRRNVARNGIQE